MADKGFDVQDLLITRGVQLNFPPFKKGDQQMCPENLAATKKIAAVHVHIHVERKIERVKGYEILSGEIDNSLFDSLEQLVLSVQCLQISRVHCLLENVSLSHGHCL